MKLSETEELFLALLRNALGTGAGPESGIPGLERMKPCRLYELSRTQGVAAIIYGELLRQGAGLPRKLKVRWGMYREQARSRHAVQHAALTEIASLLNAAGVDVMLLKGQALGSLYPVPEDRECGDIDIFCPGNYENANLVLEKNGAVIDSKDGKHAHMFFKGVPVENHLAFTYGINGANRMVGEELRLHFADNPRNFSSLPGFLTADPTMDALYLMMHTASHLAWSGIPFRNIADWVLFCNAYGAQIDWNLLKGIWGRAGMMRIATIIMKIGREHLGCPWPYGSDCPETEEKDYDIILRDLLRPVEDPAESGRKIVKIIRKFKRFLRRKRKHPIVYGEPYPESLFSDLGLLRLFN